MFREFLERRKWRNLPDRFIGFVVERNAQLSSRIRKLERERDDLQARMERLESSADTVTAFLVSQAGINASQMEITAAFLARFTRTGKGNK